MQVTFIAGFQPVDFISYTQYTPVNQWDTISKPHQHFWASLSGICDVGLNVSKIGPDPSLYPIHQITVNISLYQ